RDSKRLCRGDQQLGHLDIRARGRRIAGWVIVDQDDRARGQFQRAAYHLARIDRRMIDRADLLAFVSDEAVLLVQEEDAELLALLKRHGGVAIFKNLAPG